MTDKIKILTLSDHPLSPSGVGIQTKYIIEGLLKTGKYQVISLGGAMKHVDYKPLKTEEYGDDWMIMPVDGYGSPDQVRSIIGQTRPDILYFMTDPRFWGWLWNIENEIRKNVPMVYYHVWDNFPYPEFNTKFYKSNDYIATISKVTDDIISTLTPELDHGYVPHAVDTEIFQKVPDEVIKEFKKTHLKNPDAMVFFWNNRNARRKQSGNIIWWFKEFLDKVGHDKACLIMHTDPKDHHGQDLEHIIRRLGINNGEVMLSKQKLPPEHMAMMYNMADCTINMADAEGFGLATLESLATETPILVTMTGGLQEQVTELKEVNEEMMLKRNKKSKKVTKYKHGIGIEPTSKSVIGSQDVPYIYEDRINQRDFIKALEMIYNMSADERAALGKAGRAHVLKNYNFETYTKRWDEIMMFVYNKHGSWENRKNYSSYSFKEIV